jgi:hypothetical protein
MECHAITGCMACTTSASCPKVCSSNLLSWLDSRCGCHLHQNEIGTILVCTCLQLLASPHLSSSCRFFLPSRLDILLPFPEKKDPVWLGLFGQVSVPENSSYNNCCSELDPFTYCSHSFGSGVDPISFLLSCAFMYLNTVLNPE